MERSPSTLVLFTGSYPYGEYSFVGPEVTHLSRTFDRVVVVPAATAGQRESAPPEIEVEEGYAALEPNRLTLRAVLAALSTPLLYRELRSRPVTLVQPRAWLAVLRSVGNAKRTLRWLPEMLARRNIDPARTLFYTYWLRPTTLALSAFVARSGGRLVSRAHGFDLYHHRHHPPYIPCQAAILHGLDALFLACEHAREYVVGRFPHHVPRCEVFWLGVSDPSSARPNPGSSDGVLRIASCSYLVPVKRVERLVQAIAYAASRRPDQRIEWSHLGGGPEARRLARLAQEVMPPNVSCDWRGTIPSREIHEFYETNPVDVFATTSASEGGVPVSIMEAQRYGIPVVATAVGGIRDILSPANGVPLRAEAPAEEVGEALLRFALAGPAIRAMREESRRICIERFDADVNFRRFADRLKELAADLPGAPRAAVGGACL